MKCNLDGHRANGGKRVGSGRPKNAEWLKVKCQKLIENKKIVEFLASVANGEDVEQKINDNGEVIKIPADVRDRIKASEILIDRGFGKSTQNFESDSLSKIINLMQERYLSK